MDNKTSTVEFYYSKKHIAKNIFICTAVTIFCIYGLSAPIEVETPSLHLWHNNYYVRLIMKPIILICLILTISAIYAMIKKIYQKSLFQQSQKKDY